MTDNNVLFYIIASSALILLLAFIMVLFFNASQKKIAKTKLQIQEIELNLQRELLENTVRTQESERDRIAKDLHDEVASKLNIIHLNLHLLKQKAADQADLKEIIEHIDSSLKKSSTRARSLSHELMPPLLSKFGLGYVFDDLEKSMNFSQDIDFQILGIEKLQIKDHLKNLHIYRIVQELLNNTIKYARAKQIRLCFETQGAMMKMTYQDDGLGFNIEQVKLGHGLHNIETRIRLINGTLHVESVPNGGTTFTFLFPNND